MKTRVFPDSSVALAILSNVNLHSNVAVYLQIENLVQFAVASGILKAGDKLPAVREVCEQLDVNPNTVGKAYRDLEVMGIVYTRRGFGVFIEKDCEKKCRNESHKRVAERIFEVASEARMAGLSKKVFEAIAAKSMSLGNPPYSPVPDEVRRLAR